MPRIMSFFVIILLIFGAKIHNIADTTKHRHIFCSTFFEIDSELARLSTDKKKAIITKK